jgi:hypothetical protein
MIVCVMPLSPLSDACTRSDTCCPGAGLWIVASKRPPPRFVVGTVVHVAPSSPA